MKFIEVDDIEKGFKPVDGLSNPIQGGNYLTLKVKEIVPV